MKSYRYRALNQTGRTIRGTMSAVSEADLYYRLKELALEIVEAREVEPNRLLTLFANPVTTRDLIAMCVHLEQLERAGVPLLDSLNDIRDSTRARRLRDTLTEVCREVANGRLLSEALTTHPSVFNHLFIGLVAAGERTGQLGYSFGQLVKHLKWKAEMTNRIRKATRYPAFILVSTFIMITCMMLFLVPQLTGFLTSLNMELPWTTRSLISLSEFFQVYWWALTGTPVLIVITVRILYQMNETFAYHFDYFSRFVPVIGEVRTKIEVSRFSHFFSVMFKSGIGILDCIDSASRVVNNQSLKVSLGIVRQAVENGSSLTNAMRSCGEFPDLVVTMVKVGEESGNLAETLENVSYFFDHDVQDAVDTLISGIQPALTGSVGILMLWIIVSIMGPVYDSFSQLPL